MADNVELNAGSGGATLATDQDVALAHHQLVKIEFGADGTQTPVSAANPLPITGSLTDTELRATAVPVSGTVTASGPLTDTELRATAVPVSGTVTASGPLTDTELRATAVPVSGTVTATVTGVATAAKQLPDGHNVVATGTVTANAGTDLNTSALALDATLTDATQKTQQVGATGVVNSVFTVGGFGAAAVLQIDEAGNVLGGSTYPMKIEPVGGITANAGTNLNTSALALEAGGNLAGVKTDTAAIKTAVELIDNAISGTEMQVDVVAALPAGTNAIGKLAANSGVDIGDVDVTTLPSPISGPGNPTIDSYTSAPVNLAANTADQSIIAAPGASKQIWIYGLFGTADVAGTISIQDEDNTAGSGIMPVAVTGGFVMNPSGNFAMPWFKFATNKAVEIDTVTCTFDGVVTYAIVSV